MSLLIDLWNEAMNQDADAPEVIINTFWKEETMEAWENLNPEWHLISSKKVIRRIPVTGKDVLFVDGNTEYRELKYEITKYGWQNYYERRDE